MMKSGGSWIFPLKPDYQVVFATTAII